MLKNKKILITGATGYLGSYIATALMNENTIYALYKNKSKIFYPEKIRWIYQDLSELIDFDNSELDIIVHLAMHPGKDEKQKMETFNVNVKSTFELLELGKKKNITLFLYTSTGSVYGPGEKIHKETDFPNPSDLYSATKYAGELLTKVYKEFRVVILRIFGIYGPNQKNKLIPNLIESVRTSKDIIIKNNGEPIMNPIYIDDLVHIVIRALELENSEIINVCGLEKLSILDITNTIAKIIHKEPVIRYIENEKKNMNFVGDTTKMINVLKYTPKVNFFDGLTKVLENYQ